MSEPLGGLWFDWWYFALLSYFTLGHSFRFAGRRNVPRTGPALLIPTPSPLFLPPGKATIAVSVGKPLDGALFAKMPREEALAHLFEEVKKAQEHAEQLRRK